MNNTGPGIPSDEILPGSQIDLGDDLIEETAAMIRPRASARSMDPQLRGNEFVLPLGETIDDLLGSAKILMAEGLSEDAKRILHHVLIRDPGNLLGRRALAEIQEAELRHIVGDSDDRKHFGRENAQSVSESDTDNDVDELIQGLDQDFNLGLFNHEIEVRAGEMSLFSDPKLMEQCCVNLEKQLGESVQDWIDMGIGFLEMEIYPIAIHLFNGACKKSAMAAEQVVPLTLLALALILKNRPYEAITTLQPLLKDLDLPRENKVELYYLMGRTYEMLKKRPLAQQYYGEVVAIDPNYRDIMQRVDKK